MTKKPTTSRKSTTRSRKKAAPKTTKTDTPTVEPKLATPTLATGMVKSTEPAFVTTATPTVSVPPLKKKDLINQVVERSGMKKKDVKPVVEATLAELGHALSQDRELNLPPFAKMKIQKVKELSGARVTVARLRQQKPASGAAE